MQDGTTEQRRQQGTEQLESLALAMPKNMTARLSRNLLVGRDFIGVGPSRWLPADAASITSRRHCWLLRYGSRLRELPPPKRLGPQSQRLEVQGGFAAAASTAALRCRNGCLLDAL